MEDYLSLYRIFYTVANTENISRAARQLFISQPSLSKSITRLENQLGTQLFIRTSRGVRLTEEGQLLYGHVHSAFEAIAQGEQQLRHMKDFGISHIRIGVSTTLCKYMLLPYLKYFVERYPHIQITIQCQSSNQTLELLEQNKIDIGLVGLPENNKKYNFYALEEIEDIFVATEAYMDQLKLRHVRDAREIFGTASVMLLDKQNMTRQYIDDFLEKNHIVTKNLLVVSTMDLLIEFSKIGLGIGCVIREFVKKELADGQLIQISTGIPIHKRKIGFVTARQSYTAPAVENFIGNWEGFRQGG